MIPNKYAPQTPMDLATAPTVYVSEGPMPIKPSHLKVIDGGTGKDIGWAVATMRKGEAVRRRGWNGKGQYLKLQFPDSGSANTLPYVWIRTVQGDRVPWLASQTDLLAQDWEIVK